MPLYIDIETGTYGNADSIRFVADTDALEDMSDSEICEYGETLGARHRTTIDSRELQ